VYIFFQNSTIGRSSGEGSKGLRFSRAVPGKTGAISAGSLADAIVTGRNVSASVFCLGAAEARNGKATTTRHKENPVRQNILLRRLVSVIRLNLSIIDINYYKYWRFRKIKHFYLDWLFNLSQTDQ
jgi:hypothetical protein